MIELDSITFMYPHSSTPVLRDFSSRFERGAITAVRGRNGCGKTTLTKLIVGILRPSEGNVTIDGCDAASMNLFEIGRIIGYIFQNPNRQLFSDTVFNEVAYGLRNLKMEETQITQKVNYYLELFDLDRYRKIYPGKMSLGEKQRLALAAVLALGTEYLVLDEPTTGLDTRNQLELGDLLIKLKHVRNSGIVIVSHSADFIARCADRELVMR